MDMELLLGNPYRTVIGQYLRSRIWDGKPGTITRQINMLLGLYKQHGLTRESTDAERIALLKKLTGLEGLSELAALEYLVLAFEEIENRTITGKTMSNPIETAEHCGGFPRREIHELKTDPDQWDAVASGRKTFEIRYDDRGYKVGDQLMLRRTEHTGEEMKAGKPLMYSERPPLVPRITHIMRGPVFGLKERWVILSIK